MKHCHIFNNLNDFLTYCENNIDFEKPIDEPQDALPILAYCKLELVMRYPDQFATVYIQCLNDPNDEGEYVPDKQYIYYKGEDVAAEQQNINIWFKRVSIPSAMPFYNYSINAFMNGKDITSTNTRIVVLTNPQTPLGMIFIGRYVDYYLDIPYITGDIEIYWQSPEYEFVQHDPNSLTPLQPIPSINDNPLINPNSPDPGKTNPIDIGDNSAIKP